MSDGVALGHAVIHEPRIGVTKLLSDDPAADLDKLDSAIFDLRQWIDKTLEHERLTGAGEHRDVLEAYRMLAQDKGWEKRMRQAVEDGLTAAAAVERVQNASRTRLLQQPNHHDG